MGNFGFGGSKPKGPDAQSNKVKDYETALTFDGFFAGKNVIMTGATGGIGSQVARRLTQDGMSHYYP